MIAGARQLHAAGVEACRTGEFETAISCFREAIRCAPATPEFHQWLFSALLAWGRAQPFAAAAAETTDLPSFSVVVCSVNPEKFARLKQNLEASIPGDRMEIVRIADARNMGEGYNRGARQAAGDILIFCHDDIQILTANAAWRIAERLRAYDLLGVAGSTWLRDARWSQAGLPYLRGQVVHALADRPGYTYSAFGLAGASAGGVQALDGLFLAMRREFWRENPFDEGYDGFHLYDVDLSFRCHLAGHRLGVCNEILVEHGSLGRFDASWQRAAERFTERFAGKFEQRPAGVLLPSNLRLNDRDQVLQLFRALRRFGYGTDIVVGEQPTRRGSDPPGQIRPAGSTGRVPGR